MAIGGVDATYLTLAGDEISLPPELQTLSAAVEQFRAHPRVAVPSAAVALELRHLSHLIDLLQLEHAKRAAEFAAADGNDGAGPNVPFQWIRHECHLSGVGASNALAVGEQSDSLPESVRALEEGRIGYGHLALIASTAHEIRQNPAAPFDEQSLLRLAEEHSVSRFRYDCQHARHAANPARFLDEHIEAVEARRLELMPTEDGFIIKGFLDSVGGATVRAALEPLARRTGRDDTRLKARRMADAAVEVASHALDSGWLPTQAGQRPHLQVTATLETVMGLRGAPAGDVQFGAPAPAATVQRIACDAGITRVLFDSSSAIIDAGRKRRVPGAAARRALIARDKGCVWPGCDRPASLTNAHHLKHWARDHGSTDVADMVLVCLRHHWMLHEGGWQLVKAEDGRWLAVPPLPRPGTRRIHSRDAYEAAAEFFMPPHPREPRQASPVDRDPD